MNDLSNLTPVVAVVAIFIWYLIKKDKSQERIFSELSNKLEKLGKVITSLEARLASIERTRQEEQE